MGELRRYRILVLVALVALSGCGGNPTPTPTIQTAPATTTAVIATATSLASTGSRPSTPTVANPGDTPVAATTTRVAPGLATPPGAATVSPVESVRKLLASGNFRMHATLVGFTLGAARNEISADYDIQQENRHAVVTSGGQRIVDAYRIGSTVYQVVPSGGYRQIVDTDPAIDPLRHVFTFPEQLLRGLVPDGATFADAGSDTTAGIASTTYTGTVSLADAGIVDPARQGQGANATTTLWIATESGYPVAGDVDIQLAQGGTAKAHFTFTDIGQVGPITRPPGT